MTEPASPAPLVSVVVPVYDSEGYLATTLDSAMAQDYPAFELLLVDDGSTDGSGAIARDYAARHPDRVRFFVQENGGICAARNTAIAHARGRYIAMLDHDDVWQPSHLSRAVAALESDPGTVMVHSNVRFIDRDGRVVSEVPVTEPWARWHSRVFEGLLLRHLHVACCTAVFRREDCVAVGGFDLRYNRIGCEDRDLWLRLALRGRIRHLDHHGADWRFHDAGYSSRHQERMMRGRQILVERMREFPEGRRLYRKARAAIALSEAEDCCGRHESLRRLKAYARTIVRNPADRRGWRGFAYTLLVLPGMLLRGSVPLIG